MALQTRREAGLTGRGADRALPGVGLRAEPLVAKAASSTALVAGLRRSRRVPLASLLIRLGAWMFLRWFRSHDENVTRMDIVAGMPVPSKLAAGARSRRHPCPGRVAGS
ncbi:MAG: hypothetical protein M5U01_28555 [Ardenticatenaceae bacterium]|nr:hypothetical protein [Ardenticatenaceae bacterium]